MTLSTTCKPYHGCKNQWGYGSTSKGLAHRVAWEKAHGPIPKGMYVLHRCDNPPCINVEHLFLGTQAENMRDMAAKGRCRVVNKVLNPTLIKRAKAFREMALPIRTISKILGVSYGTTHRALDHL